MHLCVKRAHNYIVWLHPMTNWLVMKFVNTAMLTQTSWVILVYTGEVVRNHGVDRYRYRSVHHSDSLKNAVTCEWSLVVRSFNVMGLYDEWEVVPLAVLLRGDCYAALA